MIKKVILSQVFLTFIFSLFTKQASAQNNDNALTFKYFGCAGWEISENYDCKIMVLYGGFC